MTAGDRDLERAPRDLLSLDLGKVDVIFVLRRLRAEHAGLDRLLGELARKEPRHIAQPVKTIRFDPGHIGRLFCVALGQDELVIAALDRGEHERQYAVDPPQRPVKPEFTYDHIVGVGQLGHLLGRGEYADGDREVVKTALFFAVRGRKVDGHAAYRIVEQRVLDRRAHPLARFLDRGVAHADDLVSRKPRVDVDLDRHLEPLKSVESKTPDLCEHFPLPELSWSRRS